MFPAAMFICCGDFLFIHKLKCLFKGNTICVSFVPHKFVVITIALLGGHIRIVKGAVGVCRHYHFKAVFKACFYGCINAVICLQSCYDNSILALIF